MTYLEKVDLSHPEFGDFYDELPLWSAPFGLLLLERVPMKPGLTILDVGAGTGFLTVELAQRCGADSTVIAVDPWEPVMTRLRRKLGYLGIKNVRLIEKDAAELDLPDASVDLVVSNLGINNFERADAVLRECFRVTKPGGTVALTTNLVGHMQEFYDVYRATLVELGLADRLAALNAHINHRRTLESFADQLGRAGFQSLTVSTDSFKMRFADGFSLLRHYFIRFGFLPAWALIVPPEAVERTFAQLALRLNAIAAACGDLALTIPMAYFEARKPNSAELSPGASS
jgi:ubiquinone/menaquinone biosynthesis C-methylase UbiE